MTKGHCSVRMLCVKKHANELSRLYNEILNMCIKASEYIPATCPRLKSDSTGGRNKFPGWSKKVEHLKQEAFFWQWR